MRGRSSHRLARTAQAGQAPADRRRSPEQAARRRRAADDRGDRQYVDDADLLLRTENTAVDVSNAKMERYPNHLARTLLWASALYGVREHYGEHVGQILVAGWRWAPSASIKKRERRPASALPAFGPRAGVTAPVGGECPASLSSAIATLASLVTGCTWRQVRLNDHV
jgi:hypothetical protein